MNLSSARRSLTGFVQGIATVCLYAAIRPRFGAGPSTAAIAALSVWFLTSWMHLVGAVFTAVQIADALVALVVNVALVALAGQVEAWLYRILAEPDVAPVGFRPRLTSTSKL